MANPRLPAYYGRVQAEQDDHEMLVPLFPVAGEYTREKVDGLAEMSREGWKNPAIKKDSQFVCMSTNQSGRDHLHKNWQWANEKLARKKADEEEAMYAKRRAELGEKSTWDFNPREAPSRMTLREFKEVAKDAGYTVRITTQDGEQVWRVDDRDPLRIDVSVRGKYVIAIEHF